MVVSHVEKLIERLTGTDKVKAGADGDYPSRYRSALYYVRVVRARLPVVQVFSVAVDGIAFSSGLARELNDINSREHYCRAFWVRDQVLVEAETRQDARQRRPAPSGGRRHGPAQPVRRSGGLGGGLLDHGEQVGGVEDQVVDSVEPKLRAAVLGEEDQVAWLDLDHLSLRWL